MKCRVCKAKANVYLRYANMAFCKEHFIEFFERRVRRAIERFKMIEKGDKVVVAVSGGKDSLALLYVLNELSKTMDFEILAVTIDLGMGEYSKLSVEIAEKNYKRLGVDYRIVELEDYGFTIDDVAKYRISGRICGICGTAKRYILNKVAKEEGASKLATGHNLDDFLQVVLQGYLYGNLEDLARYYPITPSLSGLVARIKPLVTTPEKDSLIYTIAKGIEYVVMECPYSLRASSRDLKNAIFYLEERRPGTRFSMFNTYVKMIYPLIREAYFKGGVLKKCKECGEPTNADVCLFCRVKSSVSAKRSA